MQRDNDPYEVVRQFERCVASFTGSPYAVAVDSCSAALFLCCKYLQVTSVTIPRCTYVSVPCEILHAGGRVHFEDLAWRGAYQLKPYPIYDCALRFRRNMYVPGTYQCLSFHYKKPLPIGRGGMILTDDPEAVEWFTLARYHGRHEKPLLEDRFALVGWNVCMDPERAARGICLLPYVADDNPDLADVYPDLSQYAMYHAPQPDLPQTTMSASEPCDGTL